MDEKGPLGAGPGGDDEPAGEQNGTGSRDRAATFWGSEADPLAPPPIETTPGSSSSGREQQQTPSVVGERTDQEGQGKAAEDQKETEEEAASTPEQQEQSFAPPAEEEVGETLDQKQKAQEEEMKGEASEGQNTEDEEGISSIPENPQEKKDDFNEEDRLKDPGIRLCDITPTECHYEYPEYCEYPSFAYDPACDENNYHDDDPDFEKDWYKPYYWKAVVVHDCYCWADYAKPWYYWNHWDYYWDYDCGCWAYDYQPWYYWYSPATIYHSFYGYCYHYYYVVYEKVFAKDEKPTASGKMYDPGSKQTSAADTQSSAV